MTNVTETVKDHKPGHVLFLPLWLFLLAGLVFLLSLLPINGKVAYDAATDTAVADCRVEIPWWDALIVPFTGIPEYFLQSVNTGRQLGAWLVWAWVLTVILLVLKRASWRAYPGAMVRTLLLILGLLSYIMFVPYPGTRLVCDTPDTVLVNYQSHTYHSWDGVASIARSIDYHKSNGYDAFAVTEHDIYLPDIVGPDYFRNIPGCPVVFFGNEVYDKRRVHFMLYGLRETVDVTAFGRDYGKIREILDKAGGSAAAVFWWEVMGLEETLEQPLEAIELFNQGHPDIPAEDIKLAIELNKQGKLALIGSTDWHGYGYKTNVWTAVTVPGWAFLSYADKQQALADVLKGKHRTRVIRYGVPGEADGTVRFVFEPVVGLWYYITGLNPCQGLMWGVWLIGFGFVRYWLDRRGLKWTGWAGGSAFFIAIGIWLLASWTRVKQYNFTCLQFGIITLVIGAICVFLAWQAWRRGKVKREA